MVQNYCINSSYIQNKSFERTFLLASSFVFGFFLDGKDQQVPIIMGVLGNNTKTKLERKMGTEGSGGESPGITVVNWLTTFDQVPGIDGHGVVLSGREQRLAKKKILQDEKEPAALRKWL